MPAEGESQAKSRLSAISSQLSVPMSGLRFRLILKAESGKPVLRRYGGNTPEERVLTFTSDL
jgi:hypothetical protein